MSSLYSIVQADVSPVRIPPGELSMLLRDAAVGGTAVTFDDVVVAAENELHSRLGNAPATAAVQALVRPQVINVLLYLLYARKQQGVGAEINKGVLTAYEAALKWADTTGRALLTREATAAPGQGGVQVTVPAAKYSFDQLGGL